MVIIIGVVAHQAITRNYIADLYIYIYINLLISNFNCKFLIFYYHVFLF